MAHNKSLRDSWDLDDVPDNSSTTIKPPPEPITLVNVDQNSPFFPSFAPRDWPLLKFDPTLIKGDDEIWLTQAAYVYMLLTEDLSALTVGSDWTDDHKGAFSSLLFFHQTVFSRAQTTPGSDLEKWTLAFDTALKKLWTSVLERYRCKAVSLADIIRNAACKISCCSSLLHITRLQLAKTNPQTLLPGDMKKIFTGFQVYENTKDWQFKDGVTQLTGKPYLFLGLPYRLFACKKPGGGWIVGETAIRWRPQEAKNKVFSELQKFCEAKRKGAFGAGIWDDLVARSELVTRTLNDAYDERERYLQTFNAAPARDSSAYETNILGPARSALNKVDNQEWAIPCNNYNGLAFKFPFFEPMAPCWECAFIYKFKIPNPISNQTPWTKPKGTNGNPCAEDLAWNYMVTGEKVPVPELPDQPRPYEITFNDYIGQVRKVKVSSAKPWDRDTYKKM